MIEIQSILSEKINLNPYKFPAIYFLINKNKIVYIGSTTNLNDRLAIHRSNKRLLFDSFYFIRFEIDVIDEMRIKEALYITKFKPKYNIEHNPDSENIRKILFQKFLREYKSLYAFSQEIGISTTTLNKFFDYNNNECEIYTERISAFLFPNGIKKKS